MNTQPAPRRPARLLLVAVLAAFGFAAVGPIAHPQPARAGTAEYMENKIVGWINDARAARGIPRLTVGPKLTGIAGGRAATMASTGKLKHVDCLSCLYRSYDVWFRRCAETIAYTSYPWGYDAARSIFNGWKRSSGHWSVLMSRSYKRIGIGVAYRSSNRTSWAAANLAG